MILKPGLPAVPRCLLALCAASLSASVLAQGQPAAFAGTGDSYAGDHIRVFTHVIGFKESRPGAQPDRCAPRDSGLAIRHEAEGVLTVRFYDIPKVTEEELKKTKLGEACLAAGLVSVDSSYTIAKKDLLAHDFKRSGFTFGGLVVPFKFRLGGDNAVTSSSTVAPYVGLTSRHLQFFGVSLNPVVTAGVGFVPIVNPATGASETKSAFSFGAGFVMTSSKNEQFSAGLLFGRDVLSKSDRALDPNADKPWLSFYLGVAM